MGLRLGIRDSATLQWFDRGVSWTVRQVALLLQMLESVAARRLAQFVEAGIASRTPLVPGASGRAEHQYFVSVNDVKRLHRIAPWIDLQGSSKRALGSIAHLRLANTFWSCLEAAIQQQDYYSYDLWPYYRSRGIGAMMVHREQKPKGNGQVCRDMIPDLTLVFDTPSNSSSLIFVEIDIGSEPLNSSLKSRLTLLAKLQGYSAFHDSNGYQEMGTMLGKQFCGFRVLIVTTSARRADNIADLCKEIGESGFVYVSTIDKLTPKDILGPIWMAGEGRESKALLRRYDADFSIRANGKGE